MYFTLPPALEVCKPNYLKKRSGSNVGDNHFGIALFPDPRRVYCTLPPVLEVCKPNSLKKRSGSNVGDNHETAGVIVDQRRQLADLLH